MNSFYDEQFYKFKDKQIKDLKLFINNWNSNKNLVLVTHFVVVSEILNESLSFIVSNNNKKFKLTRFNEVF